MTEAARVETSYIDGVARLTLANPARKNAITLSMTKQIAEFCERVENDHSIGAAIVDAQGSYFCSGADTRDLAASSNNPASAEGFANTSAVYGSFFRIGQLPVPTVSLVTGGAVGAGLNLALATDVMIVTADAVLDSGFLARRIHPGGGHLRLLGRFTGYQQAFAMAGFGVPVSGEQAVSLGLAWRAVDADSQLDVAFDMVKLAAQDPELARRIKASAKMELEAPGVSWPAALEIERGVQMWSLGRKGSVGWDRKPEKPVLGDPS